MKNHTYYVKLRVLHSVPLRFTLIFPKTNHSLMTGLYFVDLVERDRHLERVRTSALWYAHTGSDFQMSTCPKFSSTFSNHSLNTVDKGTGGRYRRWNWSGAPMGACTVRLLPTERSHHDTGVAGRSGWQARRAHMHPDPAPNRELDAALR